MKQKTVMSLALALVIGSSFGCMKTEQATGETAQSPRTATTAEIPGTANPDDLNPIAAQTYVDDVMIGHMLGSDGTMMMDHMAGTTGTMAASPMEDSFAQGQPVHVTMSVKDAPADSAVRVVWYGPNDEMIAEEQKHIPAGANNLAFSAMDTSMWPMGDCRAEVWIGDERVSTKSFMMTAVSTAKK